MRSRNVLKSKTLLAILLLLPLVSFAGTSRISILPEGDISVPPNALSGQLTVQSQDDAGTKSNTAETINLIFESSSPTGEFLNSSGNPVLKTINSGDANRNFYYRDSTEGNFTITVRGVGRTSGKEWEAAKEVRVASDAPLSGLGEVAGTSTSAASAGGSAETYPYYHQLEVTSGSDRWANAGSPVWFRAGVKKNTAAAGIEFNWSFGDGNVGVGDTVTHTYKYPGEYAVVLSARAGEVFSVSRFKVKVSEPQITVEDKGGYLEIWNRTGSEVNLFNWKLESGGRGFMFQPNTILLPNSSMKLDKALLNMKGADNSQGLSLKNYLGEEVFYAAPAPKADLAAASKDLESIKSEFSKIEQKARVLGISQPRIIAAKAQLVSAELAEPTSTDQMAAVIYEGSGGEGIWHKLTNFVKRVFSK